jgi:hypothetical protein
VPSLGRDGDIGHDADGQGLVFVMRFPAQLEHLYDIRRDTLK